MKTALLLSIFFILTVACGQSATPEPANELPRTGPVIQLTPTTAIEESPSTMPPTVGQTTDKRESIPTPPLTPPRKQEDYQKSTPDQSDDQVAVSIYLIGDGQEEKIVKFIESNGGDPRNVSEGYIEAYIPVRLLAGLSERSEVARVQKIIPPEPN